MRNWYYGDKHDIVKWGTVLAPARKHFFLGPERRVA